MSIASLSHWIQSTDLATTVRESELLYPWILTLHLASIGLFGGLILITDLRLLGVIMQTTPAPQVIRGLRLWKTIGFVVMASCGILLALSRADYYYPNPYFQVKMLLLGLVGLHAIAFHRSVYAKSAHAAGTSAKVAGALSLVLWTCILCMGRWIAYYEPSK